MGGVDSVDASLFDAFDYVALGHLHSPQKVGRDAVRYCGTPLKYSFSEARQHKSATFVELGPKGEVSITTAPLTPKHDLREVRGSYMELTDRRRYDRHRCGRLPAHHPDRRAGCAGRAGPPAGDLPQPDAAGLRQSPHPGRSADHRTGARREHHPAGALLGVLPAAEQPAPDGGAGGILPAAH